MLVLVLVLVLVLAVGLPTSPAVVRVPLCSVPPPAAFMVPSLWVVLLGLGPPLRPLARPAFWLSNPLCAGLLTPHTR